MTLHDEIMNIPCEPIEGTESEVLAFKLGHKQALGAAAELADKQWIGHAPFHDRPVGEPCMLPTMHDPSIINSHYPEYSLSSAMKFLESNDVQMRREQKLRDEVAALRSSLRRCLSEAEGWLAEARGASPENDIDYDGWADDARRLLREGD